MLLVFQDHQKNFFKYSLFVNLQFTIYSLFAIVIC